MCSRVLPSSTPANALCCLSFEGSVFRRVSKNTIVRTAFSFLFFSLFFVFLFFFLYEHVLRVFVVSSFHPRGRRHRSFSTDRSTGIDFQARRRRSLLSNIRGRAPCRVAGSPYPGERRFGAAETGNTLYAVCARRDRFADTLYREPATAVGSHSVSIFIRAPDYFREERKLDLSSITQRFFHKFV